MNYLLLTQARLNHASPPLIMRDERLDFYGDLYHLNPRLAWLGISFEVFLSDPESFIGAEIAGLVALDDAAEFLRLLPAQRAVRDRIDASEAGQMELALGVSEKQIKPGSAEVHDGALFEKLRHHAWPRVPTYAHRKNPREATS
jgi:hypothetical protein